MSAVRELTARGQSFFLFLRTERLRSMLSLRRGRPRTEELDLLEVAVREAAESERPVFFVPLALFWRKGLTEAGFVIKKGESPIVPIMLYNAKLSQDVARDLFDEGIYVIGFFFPVVPAGQARIRTQMTADVDIPVLARALEAFKKVGDKYGILGLDKKGIIAKYGA